MYRYLGSRQTGGTGEITATMSDAVKLEMTQQKCFANSNSASQRLCVYFRHFGCNPDCTFPGWHIGYASYEVTDVLQI